jgi:pimeloyl-ACP methyl ester carboxylesterase
VGSVTGNGPPVVLIHGVGLTSDSWGAQIDALNHDWTVYALDTPGHGDSARLASVDGLRSYSTAIADVIADIGAPVHIAGHSLGGLIVLDLAENAPELLRSVSVLNSIHRRTEAAAAAVRARADGLSLTEPNDPMPPLTRWFPGQMETPEAQACLRWLSTADPAGYKDAYTVFATSDSPQDEALSALQVPALLLTGTDDPNSTPAMAERMATLVPNGRTRILPNAAHMAMMTHPEQVNATLHRFFSDHQA